MYLLAPLQDGSEAGGTPVMARVRVEYFAVLRERAGCREEELDTQAGSARALFAELEARHGFPRLPSFQVAINEEFRDWDSPVSDGDTIVFIPPVAGG